jgi:hypothetical protein
MNRNGAENGRVDNREPERMNGAWLMAGRRNDEGDDMTRRLVSYGLGVMRRMGSSRRTPGACVASQLLHSLPGSRFRYLCKVVSAPK